MLGTISANNTVNATIDLMQYWLNPADLNVLSKQPQNRNTTAKSYGIQDTLMQLSAIRNKAE